MRYVKTNNGIGKLDADREHLAEYMNGKQANTIEELCDEFVGIDRDGHYLIYSFDVINKRKIVPLEKVEYYGAIWTDKGLIYVAKINEKGELELL